MLSMPRIIYAMASDGLIFRFLSCVHRKFHTPLIATLMCGLIAAGLASCLDLHALVGIMILSTLLAYTLVAFNVLILR